MQILYDITEVREYGNAKYNDSMSWKKVAPARYVDAMLRHMTAFVENWWSKDEESGIEHYKHMACNMAFLCTMLEDVRRVLERDQERN